MPSHKTQVKTRPVCTARWVHRFTALLGPLHLQGLLPRPIGLFLPLCHHHHLGELTALLSSSYPPVLGTVPPQLSLTASIVQMWILRLGDNKGLAKVPLTAGGTGSWIQGQIWWRPQLASCAPSLATSAATCRLASGSRCEASQWGQGANSRLQAEQLFFESRWPGATLLLCSRVDKVLYLEEALSRLQGH